MTLWRHFTNGLALVATALALTACGGGSSSTNETPPAATAPQVATAPAALSVLAGQPASFTVTASGTAPLTYQWQRDGVDIPGATASTYTVPATAIGDNGTQIRVRVTNAAGSATSAAATLTVQAPVAAGIVAQPVGITVTAGNAASFSVQAEGSGPLTYQWQRDGTNIAGATGSSYALASPSLTDSGALFRVVVSNSAGSVTSGAALLTVVSGTVAAPTISTQPEATAVLEGDSVVLSVAAAGTGPFSYQWRRNGTAIAGAVEANFSSSPLTLADTGAVFSVVVGNGGGSVTSANAAVQVNPRPVAITTQPRAATAAVGAQATFTTAATGSDPKTYQWQRNGTALAGATQASYTTPAVASTDNGALYAVVVSNAAGSVTSSTAMLTVVAAPAAPSIATQPANVTVSEGQAATFSVGASGTGTLAYQWQRNGSIISGATAASYTLASTTAADNAARFTVVVSNSVGPVTSAEAVLTVQATPPGPLVGRAWATPQSLEENTSAISVLDRRAAIDDAGNVTVLFRKNNGTRDVIYATRGTPNGPGQAPTWTAPVAIDVLAGAPVSSMGTAEDYSLTAAPGGDLVALWFHNAACTASTYRTSGTCKYYHYARYRAASSTWEAPVLLTDASSPGFGVFTNDRGDLVFFGNSWVRSGTTNFTAALALFMRSAGETTTRRQLLNAEPINAYQLGMDAAGNLLLAAQYQQNATTDLVAYRGTVAAGLGPFQVLDSRGAAATLKHTAVGLGGQQVITWTQNNGTKNTTFAATSPTPTDSFSVADLDRLLTSGSNHQKLLVTDRGEAIYYDLWPLIRVRWTAATGWGVREAMPSALPFSVIFGSAPVALNRNGDILAFNTDNYSFSSGRSATYDAARNAVALAWPTNKQGPSYVLGLETRAGYGIAVLSVSGVGFIDLLNRFDVLPTIAAPAGDGRAVDNLWGVFLK